MISIQDIEKAFMEHPVMKEILKDSFGGICYNHSNKGKYNSEDLLLMWEHLTANQKEAVNGIIKGAINFIKEEE